MVHYLTSLYIREPLAQTVYITLIELVVSLLWAPYLEPTKELILKRQSAVELIEEIILTELFKQNFDVLDIILEPCNIDFGDCLATYQRVILYQVLQKIQTGAPDGVSSKNFNKAAIFFTKYILQKLWQGSLGNSTSVINCFSKLRDWISKEAEPQITCSLHRAILYFLSLDTTTVEQQRVVLKVVHYLTENLRNIFTPTMLDYEFVICVSHLLRCFATSGDWGRVLEDAANSLIGFMKDTRPDLVIYIEPESEIPLGMP